MQNHYPNLKVFVSNDIIRHFPVNLDKNTSYIVNFYVSLKDINFDIGKKIYDFIDEMEKRGFNFKILPIPRCLFKSNYPKIVREKMINTNKKFFIDDLSLRLVFDEEIEEFEGMLYVYEKCSKCEFRTKKMCEGIYGPVTNKVRCEKTFDWFLNEIAKNNEIKFLDLGCGNSPFIKNYEETAGKNNSMFFCVDPSDISISILKTEIPECFRSKIFPLMGIGECIPFKDDKFDYVLLQYSYSHFMDLEETLKNIHRILKRSGILLIFEAYHTKGNTNAEKTVPTSFKNIILNMIEFRNHNLKDAIKILNRHGFEVLDSFESRENERVSWGVKLKKV